MTAPIEVIVPDPVRTKAEQLGAGWWVDELPMFAAEVTTRWGCTVRRWMTDGTEAVVAEVERTDGSAAVLKLPIPRAEPLARNEILVLRAAAGEGCARLIRADPDLGRGRSAILMELLGPAMVDCGLPIGRRHRILVDAAARLWRPPDDDLLGTLPDGRTKAEGLATYITEMWETLGRPCSERAVAHALACARSRAAAHDPDRAVVVHGDVHQWNALRDPARPDRFKLVDPDGLIAEPEFDLGVLMREDPVELLDGDPWERARRFARWTGTDPVAIWEWGVVERVSTGLLATRIDLQPVGAEMLATADHIAARVPASDIHRS